MLKFTVKQARMYADLTMEQMGEFLNMCTDSYRAREKSPGKFSVSEGKKISEVTGVPMDLIIF